MRRSLQILILILIGGLFLQTAHAQIKCKYDYEESDPFTGKLARGTTTTIFPTSISTREYWEIGFERINDTYTVSNNISIAGKSNEYLYQGDSLMFATKDGNIITCYANEKVNPESHAERVMNRDIITTKYVSTYAISRRQMEALARTAVTSIRINIGEEVFQQEIKSRHAKNLMQDANCILQ
jgi:hypothetical protein